MPERFTSQAHAAHLVELTSEVPNLIDGAATFLGEGLSRRDHVLAFVASARRPELLASLQARGFAVEALLENGALQVVAAEALARMLTHPSEEKRLRDLESEVFGPARTAMTRAPSGRVRIYNELCSLLWSGKEPDWADALERQINAFAFSHPVSVFCGYSMSPESPGNERLRALHSELLWDPRAGAVEQRLRLLARASEVLASTLDYETTLQNVVGLVLPVLGDFGFFDVVEADGEVRRLAQAHDNPPLQAALAQTRWQPSDRQDMNLCGLSTGRSGFHSHIEDDWLQRAAAGPEHLEVMRSLGFCSMITVPLLFQGRRLGALTLFHAVSQRHHTHADVALCEELARRAASAVENARLYQDLQQAVRDRDEADRRKDEFLAMLGHELRNPLAPILTAARVIELKGDTGVAREREVISRQAQHLTRLVDDLLDVARIVRGKIELKKERIDIRTSIERAAEIAAPLIEERSHRLAVELESDLFVDADAGRVAQIFTNLLTNAAKYTEPGGDLRVVARREGPDITVTVSDTGAGIAPEHLGRLFEQFFQAESTLDRARGGLGLGLALVKSLTSLHGGTIDVRSEGRGKGSQFTVTLPYGGTPVEATRPDLPSPVPAQGRLLVVDDNEDLAHTLGDALRYSGYEVQVVTDPARALEAAASVQFDVALLDIGLPVMDGYELARRLRALSSDRPLRLIAVSGYGTEKDHARSADAGFERHLVKPVDLLNLLGVIAGK